MKITKFGHCCLLIEEKGKKILTDPGFFTTAQNEITGIDFIVITHEHQDHFHVPSVKEVLKNNPKARIVTNSAVAKLLDVEHIPYIIVEHGQAIEEDDLMIEGHGTKHAEIYKDYGQVLNTGYFIGTRLFYPGDDFYNPDKDVEILALPVAGPWCKVSEVITYALTVAPKISFPVHDAVLAKPEFGSQVIKNFLDQEYIKFISLEIGKETEF